MRGVPAEPKSISSRSWVPIPPPQHPLRTLPRHQEHLLKQTNPMQGQLRGTSREAATRCLESFGLQRQQEVLS